MSDEDGIAEELENVRKGPLDWLSGVGLFLADMALLDGEGTQLHVRTDEEVDLVEDLSSLVDLDRAELDDSVIAGGKAGRLKVEDDIGFLVEDALGGVIDKGRLVVDHVELASVDDLQPGLLSGLLGFREILGDAVVGDGDCRMAKALCRLAVVGHVADAVEGGHLCMEMELDALSGIGILSLRVRREDFDLVAGKDQFPMGKSVFLGPSLDLDLDADIVFFHVLGRHLLSFEKGRGYGVGEIGVFDLSQLPSLLGDAVLDLEDLTFDHYLAEVLDVLEPAGLVGAVDFLLAAELLLGFPGLFLVVLVPFLIEGIGGKELLLGQDLVGGSDGIQKILEVPALLLDGIGFAGRRIIEKDLALFLEELDIVKKVRLPVVLVVLEKIGEALLLGIVLEGECDGKAPLEGKGIAGIKKRLIGTIGKIGRKLDPGDDAVVLLVVFQLRERTFLIGRKIRDADLRQETSEKIIHAIHLAKPHISIHNIFHKRQGIKKT